MSGAPVVLADVERLCWRLSGWKVEQRDVSRLLAAVEAYARGEAYFAEGGTVALAEPEPQTAPEMPPVPLTGPAADVVEAECPEPGRVAQTGAQSVVHSGEITLRILVESRLAARAFTEPEPVHEHVREPVAVPPARAVQPVPTGDGETRVCRRDGCESSGIPQPITEFARNGKDSPERKFACRTCENRRKRDARRREAAKAA